MSASHESCENDTGCGTNHGSRQLNLENQKYSDLFQDSFQKEIFDAISDAFLLMITFPSRCALCVILCFFIALSRRVGALHISIIIIIISEFSPQMDLFLHPFAIRLVGVFDNELYIETRGQHY